MLLGALAHVEPALDGSATSFFTLAARAAASPRAAGSCYAHYTSRYLETSALRRLVQRTHKLLHEGLLKLR